MVWRYSLKLNKNEILLKLSELSPRERLLSAVIVVVVVIYSGYLLVFAPIATDNMLLEQKIKSQQQALQYLKKISVEVAELRKNHPGIVEGQDGESLMTIIDASSIQMAIKPMITRVNPNGADKVTLWLEHSSFDQFIDWLSVLETKHGITVNEISISLDEANVSKVSVKVLLGF